MTERDEKVYREKIYKQLDNLKEIQQHHVPELLKQLKTYEEKRQELHATEDRIKEAWEKLASSVGLDSNWGKALNDITHKQDDITNIEREWDGILDVSFVQMINKGLSQETKTTAKKEKDVRKAIIRLEQTTRNSSKSTLKRKKKADKDALEEHNALVQDVEKKRDLIASDVASQCEMTYFMILQSLSKALKQKMENYERIAGKAKDLNVYLGNCIKIQPDFASAPKASVMDAVYNEKKSNSKKEKRRNTANENSAPLPAAVDDDAAAKKGPTMYSRLAESKGPVPPPGGGGGAGATRHASLYFDGPHRPDGVASLLGSPHPELLPAQQKAVAKWAFQPQREGDLPMKAGDVMNILNSVGPWWMAEMNGVTGRIPANYVELLAPEPQKPRPMGMPMVTSADLTMRRSPRGLGAPQPAPVAPVVPVAPVAPVDVVLNDLPPPPRLLSQENVALDPSLPDLPPPPLFSPKRDNSSHSHSLPEIPPIVVDSFHAPDPTVPPRDDGTNDFPKYLPHTPVGQVPEAPVAPTPETTSEWQQHTTAEGHVYYFNPFTGESKWTM